MCAWIYEIWSPAVIWPMGFEKVYSYCFTCWNCSSCCCSGLHFSEGLSVWVVRGPGEAVYSEEWGCEGEGTCVEWGWRCETVCVVRGCILGVVKFYPASLTAYHNGVIAHLLNCKSSKVFGSYYKRASPIPPTHPSPTTHPVTSYGTAAGSQCSLGPTSSALIVSFPDHWPGNGTTAWLPRSGQVCRHTEKPTNERQHKDYVTLNRKWCKPWFQLFLQLIPGRVC